MDYVKNSVPLDMEMHLEFALNALLDKLLVVQTNVLHARILILNVLNVQLLKAMKSTQNNASNVKLDIWSTLTELHAFNSIVLHLNLIKALITFAMMFALHKQV